MFQFVSGGDHDGFADSTRGLRSCVILLISARSMRHCAGSTAGGIWVNRLVLAGKMMRTRLQAWQ